LTAVGWSIVNSVWPHMRPLDSWNFARPPRLHPKKIDDAAADGVITAEGRHP